MGLECDGRGSRRVGDLFRRRRRTVLCRRQHESSMEALAQKALADSERVLMEQKQAIEQRVLDEQESALAEMHEALHRNREDKLSQV